MEVELKLPYAECYSFEYPQKRSERKRLDDFVKKSLCELHPGFGEESLWDYRLIKAAKERRIISCVVQKDFYLEKRIADRSISFYVKDRDGRKIRMFERSLFNEKGEKKKGHIFILIMIFSLVFIISLTAIHFVRVNKKLPVLEVEIPEPVIQDALNAFDTINRFSKIIHEMKGKITEVVFSAGDKACLIFPVTGCESYELVSKLLQAEPSAEIRCENIVYSDTKENFELDIKLPLPPVKQKRMEEIELLEMQDRISQRLKEMEAGLLSASADSTSGRLSFEMECEGKELSKINNALNSICLENNLFTGTFSERASGGKNKFLIKAEFICLEEGQKLSDIQTEEILSQLFEYEREAEVNKSSDVKKATDIRAIKGWKKIGSVNKDGKTLYYYRTEEGKIETSEVNYE